MWMSSGKQEVNLVLYTRMLRWKSSCTRQGKCCEPDIRCDMVWNCVYKWMISFVYQAGFVGLS